MIKWTYLVDYQINNNVLSNILLTLNDSLKKKNNLVYKINYFTFVI